MSSTRPSDGPPVAAGFAMSANGVRQLVIEWLDDNYHFGEAASLIKSDTMSFLDNGILDSLGFVQLVLHLEKRYSIKIDRKHLSRDNFDSLGKIITYVTSHRDYKA